MHRSGPDLFERRRSNGPSGPYTTLRGEEIIYSRAVERKDYCGMASEPDLPKIADGGVERAATISTSGAQRGAAQHFRLVEESRKDGSEVTVEDGLESDVDRRSFALSSDEGGSSSDHQDTGSTDCRHRRQLPRIPITTSNSVKSLPLSRLRTPVLPALGYTKSFELARVREIYARKR